MTLFAVGLMVGLVAGMILAAYAMVHFDRLENPNPWASDTWTTESEPQRDELEDIGDPRQTARDSATSARSKTFRG